MGQDETVIRRPKPALAAGERTACLIVLTGDETGRLYRLTDQHYVLGRDDEASIRLFDEGVSRRHAELTRYGDGTYLLKDLSSKNGTFVNGQEVKATVLQDGDRLQIGTTAIFKFTIQDSLEGGVQQRLYQHATRDALTGVHNRRYFEEQLDKDCSYARRHNSALSLLMIDIDYFKSINDQHGHLAGDTVLRELGKRLCQTLRNEDVLCRIGGEEFCVILRETALEDAKALARRLLRIIADRPFEIGSGPLTVTISIGLAVHSRERHAKPRQLVADADEQLYAAKAAGRNCLRPD